MAPIIGENTKMRNPMKLGRRNERIVPVFLRE